MAVMLQDHIHAVIDDLLAALPSVSPAEISQDDTCPICLLSFKSIFAEARDEKLVPSVVKLPDCHHIFCGNDFAEWMKGMNGSCPTCRYQILDIPKMDDPESSDGGEYLPSDDQDGDVDIDEDSEVEMADHSSFNLDWDVEHDLDELEGFDDQLVAESQYGDDELECDFENNDHELELDLLDEMEREVMEDLGLTDGSTLSEGGDLSPSDNSIFAVDASITSAPEVWEDDSIFLDSSDDQPKGTDS